MTDSSSIPRGTLAGLCLLLVVTALVYVPGLDGPPLLDDNSVLLPLMQQDPSAWRDWIGDEITTGRGQLGRPVAMASFIANALLHGTDLWYWKFTNLLVHLLTGGLVFLLTYQLGGHVCRQDAALARGSLALLVAGLWLLHPLQVSTVLYTVQRMAQLSSLFVLAGLLAYVTGRRQQLAGSAPGWLPIGLAFVLCFPLAVLSKEGGLLFPFLALLVELMVFRFAGSRQQRRLLISLFILVALLPAIAAVAYSLGNYERLFVAAYENREFTAGERLLTQFRVLLHYLYLLVFPVQANMGFFHDDFTVSHGLLDPPATLLALGCIAGLIAGAVLAGTRAVLPALGILFFFVAHALESSVFSLELFFEHRNYLPAFGILLALAALLYRLLRDRRLFLTVTAGVLVLLAALTALRADTWGSYEAFYQHAWRVHPESKRVNSDIANNLAVAGRYDDALRVLEKFDDAGFVLNRLYVRCQRDRQLPDADVLAAREGLSGALNDHAVSGLINLANAGLDGECSLSGDAFVALVDALLQQPVTRTNRSKILLYKAHYQHRDLGLAPALETLRAIFRHQPHNPVALLLGCEWLLDAGDMETARAWYADAQPVVAASRADFTAYTQAIEARLLTPAN